jgi:glycosyltransferase involved in cell wall biosynthesis
MSKSLVIVQLVPQMNAGGVERGTLEVNRALVQNGHRSIVVSGGGRLVPQLIADGGEHVQMQIWKKSPLTLMTLPKLRKWIQEIQPDILHARSRIPAWLTWLTWLSLQKDQRPCFVTTVHGLNKPNIYSQVMTRGEHIIAVSNATRDYILKHYPHTDRQRITVIHRGVDPSEFPYDYQPTPQWKDDWYREFPQLRNQFIVCVPGRVTRFKGHMDFLDAIARLKADNISVHGLILGGEDLNRKGYSASLRARIRELQIQDQITFTGHRTDVKEVLSISDVVVSTSVMPPESFGRAVLESLRLGRITLGYDHGGVGEVLSTVFPEGLVPLKDTVTLARRIRDAFEGRIRRPKPNQHYLLQTMLDKEIRLYAQLCGDSRPVGTVRAA